MADVPSTFDMSEMPAQWAYITSQARVRGYGGAMGGGKTRALCEDAFDKALEYPGIRIVMFRNTHTSIEETTKLCMMEDVIPHEAIAKTRTSQGQDWVMLHNRSRIHFAGMDDPVRWFSSELGELYFDEAHELLEDHVVKLITRLRQRCMDCRKKSLPECNHYPHGATLGFNPENPGHWLYKWFIEGAEIESWPGGKLKGYTKEHLLPTGAVSPLGSAQFIFARAQDNRFLSKTYIEDTLGALPELLRKRYLDGEWLYVSGMSFFDVQALSDYSERVSTPKITGVTEHEPKIRLRPAKGPWWVWQTPIRGDDPHRYIIGVDVASGTANDFSAVQIVDVENFEQVAEYQAQVEPTVLALEVFRMATIYNMALVAPEITGGWGFTIVSELQRLKYPRLYTRPVFDRLNRKWTDALGWDTTTKSRAVMLDTLERVIREGEFELVSPRCLTEMSSFVWPDDKRGSGPFRGVPQAQHGANDDLVMSLAIAVTLAAQRPRQIREQYYPDRPQELVTGYVR